MWNIDKYCLQNCLQNCLPNRFLLNIVSILSMVQLRTISVTALQGHYSGCSRAGGGGVSVQVCTKACTVTVILQVTECYILSSSWVVAASWWYTSTLSMRSPGRGGRPQGCYHSPSHWHWHGSTVQSRGCGYRTRGRGGASVYHVRGPVLHCQWPWQGVL